MGKSQHELIPILERPPVLAPWEGGSPELEFTSLTLLDWSALVDYELTVVVYICHAMPMKEKQLRQYRKLRREA